jgi:hypothetical protein
VPNEYMAGWEPAYWNDEHVRGPTMRELPSGLASAPVKLVDLRTGDEHEVRFVAGMFGVIETVSGALAPEFGWAVVYDS